MFPSFYFTQNNKIKDIDGNLYSFDTIGNQIWMTENLRVTHFNDGTPIKEIEDEWYKTDSYAWCYFENNSSYNYNYGKLYNGYVINLDTNEQINICPVGWRVPSSNDWQILIDFLGGDSIAGYKMKSQLKIQSFVQKNEIGGYFEYKKIECPNCKLWNIEYRSKVPCHFCKDTRIKKNTINKGWDGSIQSVFNTVPSGKRYSLIDISYLNKDHIEFEDKDAACYFWSTSSTHSGFIDSPFLLTSKKSVQFFFTELKDGCSIRCIKD